MERHEVVGRVYDASYQRLVVQLLGVCGDLAEAEDAVQEAFIKAIRQGERFAGVDNPEAWLRTVAVKHVRNRWRHLAVVRRVRVPAPGSGREVELSPDHVAVVAALAQLPHDLRLTAVLHYVADLSTAKVAAELGVPEGTVKSRLSRARTALADLLREESEHV
jgi:RNA polymerase sigma factor (sigma-70 family)